jgi:hypothetical protein
VLAHALVLAIAAAGTIALGLSLLFPLLWRHENYERGDGVRMQTNFNGPKISTFIVKFRYNSAQKIWTNLAGRTLIHHFHEVIQVEQGQRQSESHIPKKLAIANDHQMAKEL